VCVSRLEETQSESRGWKSLVSVFHGFTKIESSAAHLVGSAKPPRVIRS